MSEQKPIDNKHNFWIDIVQLAGVIAIATLLYTKAKSGNKHETSPSTRIEEAGLKMLEPKELAPALTR